MKGTTNSNRNNDADTGPTAQPSQNDPENPHQAADSQNDPENPLQAADSRCMANTIKFGKFLAYLILAMAAAAVIVALGVLTLPVSAALLLAFAVTYSFITNIAPFARHQKDNERYGEVTITLAISIIMVPLVLLLPLIVIFVVFRVHSSLKHGTIAGLETWKWLLIALVSCVFCNIWVCGRYILTLVQEGYAYREELVYFTGKLRRAINCICFIVGEIIVLRVAPHSKRSKIILGLALWKWVMVLVSLLCGWYLIQVTTYLIVLSLEAWQKFWKESYAGNGNKDGKRSKATERHTFKKYAVLMAKGLRTRINILLFFLLIVLTWIFYIKPRLRLEESTEYVKKAVHFVIQTFLSLLIVAVFLLINKYLSLLWEARGLYKRFKKRIIETYTQLYILGKICGSEGELFNIWWASPEDGRSVISLYQGAGSARSTMSTDQGAGSAMTTGERSEPSAGNASREKQKDATGKFVSYDILKRMANLFVPVGDALACMRVKELRLKWEKSLRSEESPQSKENYQRVSTSKMDQVGLAEWFKHVYGYEMEGEAETCLYHQLEAEADLDTKRDVQYKDFENWMKKAHENCTQLGNIFAGAQEAVACLDKVMIGFLIVVGIVIWLFLTNIATTQLIVLFTSPLLAATLVFDDMAKKVFQGIMFTFAVHPFDVGDMCVIQGDQLKVKKIGIWKTTFYKNGNIYEEVMYPNSTLITTSIDKQIKLKLDRHDSVEFNVQFGLNDYDTEDKALNTLMEKIRSHLKSNGDFQPGIRDVMVKDIDEAVKMKVQFKHKKDIKHMTYSDGLKKKNESRSKLLQEIRKLIDEVRREYKSISTGQQNGNIEETQATRSVRHQNNRMTES